MARITDDKKLLKLQKAAGGADMMQELEAMDSDALKLRIVQARESIMQADEEIKANPKYQQAQLAISSLQTANTALKRRQNAITDLCLHLLDERGDNTIAGEISEKS